MTVVSTLDITGLTANECRAVMDELGVEARPEGGIYLHLTTPADFGFRVRRGLDEKDGFDRSWCSAGARRVRRSACNER
jgi:hypothetical protein